MATNKVSLTGLDFDEVKASLKTFMQSQAEFTDYDFEGSGLSILLDLLAYNTTMNAFYTNMLYNESFLDSAAKRSSVVSRAKELGYTPRSATAPNAILNIDLTPATGTPSEIQIPKGTKFSTTIDDTTYNFVLMETKFAKVIDTPGTYEVNNMTIYEGKILTISYEVNTSNPDQRFEIPNANADTSHMTVTVFNSNADSTSRTFTLADDLSDLGPTSLIYFLHETDNGTYELTFGDDVLGKSLDDGNIVQVEYLQTNKTAANGASSFTLQGQLASDNTVVLTTTSSATGGAEPESIASIKANAPRFYQSQNRAVTLADYKVILQNDTTVIADNVDSVYVYSGEDLSPPEYGKVYISLKPKNSDTISETLKQSVTALLREKSVLTVIPEVVDPAFLKLEITSTVKYDPDLTTQTADQLKADIKTAIENYNDTELAFFGKTFRFSKFAKVIDDVSTAINSNETTIVMKKPFDVTLNTGLNYTIDFENPIEAESLDSSYFTIVDSTKVATDKYFFKDDGEGIVQVWKLQADGSEILMQANAGTIVYTTGIISLENFTPITLINTSDSINMKAVPDTLDIETTKNLILEIDDADITITMQSEASE